jgi:outer membrane lipoprotein SlyB
VKKTTPKKITHPQKHSEPLSIPQSVPLAPPPTCYECGVIESVRDFENPGQPSGLGAAAGALLGGVLGHQVGDGDGNKLATIAGAIGGGFAGNAIEKNSRAETSSEITVRMEDGTSVRLILEAQHWRIGDKVRVVNRNLVAR